MKKLFALAAASLLVSGAAFAQDEARGGSQTPPPPPAGGGTYYQDGPSISGVEKITVTIPVRTALHITESVWNLNLNSSNAGGNLAAYDRNTGQGCFMIPKHVTRPTDFVGVTAQMPGGNPQYPIAVYPAVKLDRDDVAKDSQGNYLKGGLVCFNRKIVQKFSNAPGGYKFTVDVSSTGATPGLVGLADYVATGPNTFNPAASGTVAGRPGTTPFGGTLLTGSGTTNGFLDDLISEFIYFDGTETAGTANISVKFTLAGL